MQRQIRYNRSFVLYIIGQTVSSLGDGFYMIALMWLAMKLSGGRGIVLGGVFSIYTLCAIVFGFIAGPVADRFNKKRILIVVDIIRGLLVFTVFLLVQLNFIVLFHLYIITFLFSGLSPFFYRTEFTIIPLLVEKEALLKANGILSGSKRLMQVISPALGGILLSIFGVAGCFLFDAFSFFFSVLCIIPIGLKMVTSQPVVNEKKPFFVDIKQGYDLLIKSPFLLTLGIYAMCINFFGAPVFPLLPMVSEKINIGPSGYGFMMGAISAGLIVSSLCIGFIEKVLKPTAILLAGLILSGCAIGLIAIDPFALLYIVSAFFLGFGMNMSNLPIIVLFQKNLPVERIGVVSSFVFTFAQIAMPISLILSGFLVDTFSLMGVLGGISIILIIGAITGFMLPGLKEPVIAVSETT